MHCGFTGSCRLPRQCRMPSWKIRINSQLAADPLKDDALLPTCHLAKPGDDIGLQLADRREKTSTTFQRRARQRTLSYTIFVTKITVNSFRRGRRKSRTAPLIGGDANFGAMAYVLALSLHPLGIARYDTGEFLFVPSREGPGEFPFVIRLQLNWLAFGHFAQLV
jgi:hypothetical protein